MKIEKFRDITLIHINEHQIITISCDSSGGIGDKELDIVKTTPEIVGFFTTNVALAETLAIGATPITISNTLTVEMESTGKKIIEGVKKSLRVLPNSENIAITGSTEDNFHTLQTGMGITVIGVIDKNKWKKPITNSGDLAVVVGLPKVGHEVLLDKGKEILSLENLLKLTEKSFVNEILPVGSKGILYEANVMAESNNLSFLLEENVSIDINKSAGPATCAVVSIKEEDLQILKEYIDLPINIIGKFK